MEGLDLISYWLLEEEIGIILESECEYFYISRYVGCYPELLHTMSENQASVCTYTHSTTDPEI